MIVPMKKSSVIVLAKDTQNCLIELRRLGVLHIEHHRVPQGKDITSLKDEIGLLNEALGILIQTDPSCPSLSENAEAKVDDWGDIARHIIDTRKKIEHTEEYSRNLSIQIEQWEPWGDFYPEDIKKLGEKGIYIKLYQVPDKNIKELPKDLVIKIIFMDKGVAHCLVIGQKEFSLSFKEISLPQMGLEAMRKRLLEDKEVLKGFNEDLRKSCNYYQMLIKIKKKLGKELEMQETMRGMGEAGELAYVTGYIPVDATQVLSDLAKKERWGIFITDPTEEDFVPTLIRNKRWINTISPLFKMLEVIPGYRELDVSPLVLIFFSLFFAMIISDAGYGLIFFSLTVFAYKKIGKKFTDKTIFFLFYLLSSCTILWGLITGTFFGQEWNLKGGLKPLVPALNKTEVLQAFCFFIGALQLTLAHLWRALRQFPALTVGAEIGWIAILWAAFFLAKTLILGDMFPFFGKWLIIGGITLVIFFSSPQRNILKTIAKGLASVALSLTNNFTDVVSYIRLFAIGLATVAIADTVNTLAASAGGTNWLIKMPILLVGHTINFVLGPVGVLVHGVRLNVLEFSSHIGVSWSGVRYQPLKESKE
jgi:V/A-type H+-transporting ATPase subunit I